MSQPLRVLSLMSGTSADGIDAVLAHFELNQGKLVWDIIARKSVHYEQDLRERILTCLKPESSDVRLLTQVHADIGRAYAELVSDLQSTYSIDVVALSGQTVYHIPRTDTDHGWHSLATLQLGEAAIVCETCQLPVVSDFRQSDMAAGGQGAPLVSFGDTKLYHEPHKARSIHNLGGISNLTYLPADGRQEGVSAFDTGPANCLIDEAVKQHFGQEFDHDGKLAAQGQVDKVVLAQLMNHPYLQLSPPKTTGREIFTLSKITKFADLDKLTPLNLVTTLTDYSAQSIARAYKDFVIPHGLDEILLAGGGSANPVLVEKLTSAIRVPVKCFEDLGWRSKDREALAFAVMAYYRMLKLPNTLAQATGARHATIAGKLNVPNTQH